MGTGPPFYVVIRATRMSSRLQGKGIEVPSFLSYFKTLSIGYDPEDPEYWICFLGVNECCGRIMHQSIPAAPSAPPPLPGLLRCICPPCQSRGLGICKFFSARAPGICQPRGHSRAFDKHAVSYQNITTQKVLLEKTQIGSSVKDRNKL